MATFKYNGNPELVAPGTAQQGDVTALVGGGYVVVWLDEANAIKAQIFDSAGQKVGVEIVVDEPSAGTLQSAKVAAGSDGSFAIVWRELEQHTDSSRDPVVSGAFVRTFASSGVATSDPIELTLPTDPSYTWSTSMEIEGLPDGKYLIVAARFPNAAFVVFSSGQEGPVVELPAASKPVSGIGLASSDSGVSLAVWTSGAAGTGTGVYASFFDQRGNLLGDVVRIDARSDRVFGTVSAAALPDGNFVVVWSDGVDRSVHGVVIDKSGRAVVEEFLVGSPAQSISSPKVTSLPDGGFFVIFMNDGPRYSCQQFDAAGTALGAPFHLGDPVLGQNGSYSWLEFSGPEVARLDNGQVVAVWNQRAYMGPDDFDGLATRRVELARATIGTASDDILSTGSLDDRLDGDAGVDTAAFSVTSISASFSRNASNTWTVNAGADGVDTLMNMEFVQFTNRTLALRPAEGTIDGNGTSDILLRNTSGTIALWTMSGATPQSRAIVAASDATFAAIGQGDFNGDGKFDVLFRNPGGVLAQWQMNGASVSAIAAYVTDPTWQIVGVGDFNGDFKDDILYRNPGGLLAQWQMNGLSTASVGVFAGSDTSWSVSQVADFDGDGKDDILWRNAGGEVALWKMDGFAVASAGVFALSDPTWQIVGTGDFNGDLREDILWRSSGGVLAQWQMDGASVTAAGAFALSDPAWSVSDIGDYNGDGKDDILWQGPDGTFALWTLNGLAVTSTGIIGNPGAGWNDIQ